MKTIFYNYCCTKNTNSTVFKASLKGAYPNSPYFEKVADNFNKKTSQYPNHILRWCDYYLHPEHFLLVDSNGNTSFHVCSNENLIKSQSIDQLTEKLVYFFNKIIKNK